MAGTSAKSTVIALRVPNTMAEVWQSQALEAGTPLSTFVLQLLIDKPVNVLTNARAALVEQQAEIGRLTDLLDARDLLITNVLHPKIEELEAMVKDRERSIVASSGYPYATHPLSGRQSAPDYLPPVGGKAVAAVLPVAGTQFPPRPTHLRGQEPGKKGSKS